MNIDLLWLHNGQVSEIDISGVYSLENVDLHNTDIIRLSDLVVHGTISRKENEDAVLDDYLCCSIKGIMILTDSISLEEVDYPFLIDYDDFVMENWIKNKNTLDIFSFLWENIVLEVPLQFTKVRDLSKFHGDGWKLISEDELENQNNPFRDLLKDFEKE